MRDTFAKHISKKVFSFLKKYIFEKGEKEDLYVIEWNIGKQMQWQCNNSHSIQICDSMK